jgi:hypothetical protein
MTGHRKLAKSWQYAKHGMLPGLHPPHPHPHLCVWDILHFMLKQEYLFFLVLNMAAVYVLYINTPVKNLKIKQCYN